MAPASIRRKPVATAIATYAGAGLRKLEASREVGPEVAKLLAEISLQARRAGEIATEIKSQPNPDQAACMIEEFVHG